MKECAKSITRIGFTNDSHKIAYSHSQTAAIIKNDIVANFQKMNCVGKRTAVQCNCEGADSGVSEKVFTIEQISKVQNWKLCGRFFIGRGFGRDIVADKG